MRSVVRIQAGTENNMCVIFFCSDFSTFSYWKLASDIFGGVHKQCGLSKGRGRGCWAAYVIIQFEVHHQASSAIASKQSLDVKKIYTIIRNKNPKIKIGFEYGGTQHRLQK